MFNGESGREDTMDNHSYAPKRIFLGLILSIIMIFGVAIYYLWHLSAHQDQQMYRTILTGLIVFGFFLLGIGALVLGGMVVTIIRSKTFSLPLLQNLMRFTLGQFFPLVLQMGKVFRIKKYHIMQSFIQVNNQMVLAKKIKAEADQILILLPHCIQEADCKYKITRDINNCKQCGKCSVSELLDLSRALGVKMHVATGGTLARQIVKSIRPKVIIAVACERDLVSGIIDSMPLPVLGVLNVRPNGPCFNTSVVIEDVEQAVKTFTTA